TARVARDDKCGLVALVLHVLMEVLPQFLSHERHERVQEPQRAIQRQGKHRQWARGARWLPCISCAAYAHLCDLDVPVSELAPEELVHLARGLAHLHAPE